MPQTKWYDVSFSKISTFSSNETRVLLTSLLGGIWYVYIMFCAVFCVVWADALKYELVKCKYEQRLMIKLRHLGETMQIQEEILGTHYLRYLSALIIFSPQFLKLWNCEMYFSIELHPFELEHWSHDHRSHVVWAILLLRKKNIDLNY